VRLYEQVDAIVDSFACVQNGPQASTYVVRRADRRQDHGPAVPTASVHRRDRSAEGERVVTAASCGSLRKTRVQVGKPAAEPS